jgi:hypothetical protein
LAVILTGCLSIHPRAPLELAAADTDQVIEHNFRVPIPVTTAYRNTLVRALECLQHSGRGFFFSVTYRVESEPFDAEVGFARISVRLLSADVITTVITLKPIGTNETEIIGRNLNPRFALGFIGEQDLPNLAKWALGQPIACTTKILF